MYAALGGRPSTVFGGRCSVFDLDRTPNTCHHDDVPSDYRDAVDAVIAALATVGITAQTSGGHEATDLAADVNGVRLGLDVKAAATVTPESLPRYLRQSTVPRRPNVAARTPVARLLAADRIVPAARQILRDAGWSWLDLRGHLRLSAPGVLVDTDVPAALRVAGPVTLFPGKVSLEVACALLRAPERTASVRQLARDLGRSPSSVSAAVNALREAQLVDNDGRPVTPELFWEAAGAWRPATAAIARIAPLGDPAIATALRTSFADPATTGWALTDTVAAAAYGAPAGVRADYPPDFYVPDAATARRAETLLGAPASDDVREATIKIAPVAQACAHRFPASPQRPGWPLAHPLFVALDLAADPGRGREILEGWDPPHEATRVW